MTLRTTAKRGWSIKWGCNSAPTTHDFPDNSSIYVLFFTMRTGPFCTGSVLRLDARWEPGGFSLRTILKTDAGFQSASEKSSTLVAPPLTRAKFCPSSPEKNTLVSRGGRFSHRADATQPVQTLTSDRAGCRLLWHLAWPPQAPPDRIFSFWAIFAFLNEENRVSALYKRFPKGSMNL
jgi:hypothetical protein